VITLRRRLLGLVALLAILGIIIGLPTVLLAVGANPFSGGLPTFEAIKTALTSPDDGTLAVALIKIVAWASWGFLTLSILLEVLARLRGVRAPRLPGLRLPQNAARGLVGTAMMLFVAIPTAGIANAAPAAPVAATASVTTTVVSAAPAAAATQTQTTAPAATSTQETPAPATVKHTVKQGETLWSIASDHLGDGHRYKEIVELNRSTLGNQPGFIKAGWVLDVPAPPAPASTETGTVVVEKGDTLSGIALEQYGDATRYPEIFEASRSITQPGGAKLTDPDVIDVGWTLKIPAQAAPQSQPAAPAAPEAPAAQPQTTTPAQPSQPAPAQPAAPAAPAPEAAAPSSPAQSQSPAQTQAAPETAAADHLQDESPWMARTSYGVGALLAAGVIALLATRRRTQQRRRRPGQRMPMPTGAAALVEQELRATADALSIETVDVALRSLARSCTEAGVALPAVRAARLTATQFDLYLAEPAELPEPWTGTADDTVWTLEVDNTAELEGTDISDIPAPYPALVTIGHDEEDGHVLLDLEFLGSIGVSGQDDAATREILAALAIELANSTWADDLQVTLVGAFPDLEDTLQTGRIRYLPSAGRILEDLLHRADLDREAMSAEGAPDLHHARVTGAAPDAWAPEIVLLAGDITDRQRNQLEQLVTDLPRVALATVTNGLNVGEWGLDLTAGDGPDYAVLNPIGLQLRPQRLPAEQYGHLLEIASLADVEELDPTEAVPPPSLAEVESVQPVDEPSAPVSAMPEITLEHLEAVAGAGAVSSSPAAMPTFGPLIPQDERPTDDVDDPTALADAPTEPQPVDEEPPSPPTPADPAEGKVGPGQLDDQDPETQIPTDEADEADTTTSEATAFTHPRRRQPRRRRDPRRAHGRARSSPGGSGAPHAAPDAQDPRPGPGRPRQRRRKGRTDQALTPPGVRRLPRPDPRSDPHRDRQRDLARPQERGQPQHPQHRHQQAAPMGRHRSPQRRRVPPAPTSGGGLRLPPRGHHRRRRLGPPAGPRPAQRTHRAPRGGTRPGARDPLRGNPPQAVRLGRADPSAPHQRDRRRLLRTRPPPLMEGRWRGAEEAVVVGLRIEPAQENLWRLRILAAHESRNPAAEAEAIERLLTITEQLECDLEPETEQLLAALKTPGTDFDKLMANAL
jgi:nucleoid-associated protein YgaU